LGAGRDILHAGKIFGDFAVHRAGRKLFKPKGRKRAAGPDHPVFANAGVIFVHIPKTAGTSVRSLLAEVDAEAAKRYGETPQPRLEIAKHATAAEIRDALGADAFAQHFSITFVRNPWDLMVSSYFWWCQHAIGLVGTMHTSAIIRRMTFDEFIRSIYGQYFINEYHGTMSDWFTEPAGDLVNFVGTVETLETDLRKICARLDIEPASVNPAKLNTTERAPYRDYYTAETREMVRHRFQDVIHRFGYTF
jgi:hypothetical protein